MNKNEVNAQLSQLEWVVLIKKRLINGKFIPWGSEEEAK